MMHVTIAAPSLISSQDSVMKRVVVSALLAACLAQPAAQAVAGTVSDQCFALGDIAGQVASWRAHKKTRAQALDQAARYYKDPADRQAIDAVIQKLFSPDTPPMTPDQASMAFTSECLKSKHGQAPGSDAWSRSGGLESPAAPNDADKHANAVRALRWQMAFSEPPHRQSMLHARFSHSDCPLLQPQASCHAQKSPLSRRG